MPTTPPSLQPPTGMTLILWGAFALLSITLLVLMRTRWGQARPLTKCVMLSLAAHLLLVGVASVTRLINDLPPGPKDTFRVSFEAGDHADSQRSTAPEEAQPWNRPVITPSATPPPVDAIPRLHDVEQPLPEQKIEQQASLPGDGMPPDAPTLTEDRPLEEPAFELAAVPQDMRAEASPIDVPAHETPAPREADPTPTPAIDLPPRHETPSEVPQPAAGPHESPTPVEESDTSQHVQELADAVVRTTPADAVAAAQDNLESAENQSRNAGQESAPASPLVAIASESAGSTAGETAPGAMAVSAAPAPPVADASRVPIERPGGGMLPDLYRSRVSPDRDELARRYGGNAATQAAVEAALAWLAAHQAEDGRWDPEALEGGQVAAVDNQDRGNAGAQADCGITGLAVLAFLGNGHTHIDGPYQRHVQHGLEFLIRSQKTDGNMAGDASLFASMYCHGMATLAISEAYAITGDRRLLPYVQRAVNYTVSAQHSGGGWRYQPGDEGDMSQFGWQVMALKSAELAGVRTPEPTRAGMNRFLASMTFGTHGGLCAYRRNERASRTMTAESLVCRIFLEDSNQAARQEAATYIVQELPDDGRINLYYWYYGTLALHQMQGEHWQLWNAALQERLLRGQRAEGPLAGSWDPDTQWGNYGGRAYSTAMAALCLEVYHRYLPLYGDESNGQP